MKYYQVLVTAIYFILPSVLTFECESKYTEYSKETNKRFLFIKQPSNKIMMDKCFQIWPNINKYLQKGEKLRSNYL